jgi:hypothetical protein
MDPETTTRQTSTPTSASVGTVDAASPGFTYLQTARVWVTGPTGLSKLTRCVLDGRSQCSFVAKSIIDDLGLKVIDHRDLLVTAFETGSRFWPMKTCPIRYERDLDKLIYLLL